MAYDKNRVAAIEAKLVGTQPKKKRAKPMRPASTSRDEPEVEAKLIPPAKVRAAKPRVVRY